MTRIYTILKYIAAVLLLTWYTFWLLLYFKIRVVVTSHRCRKILFCRCRRLKLRHMVYCSRECYPSDVVCNRGSRGDLRESHGKRVVFQFPQTVWEVGRRFEHEARERGSADRQILALRRRQPTLKQTAIRHWRKWQIKDHVTIHVRPHGFSFYLKCIMTSCCSSVDGLSADRV